MKKAFKFVLFSFLLLLCILLPSVNAETVSSNFSNGECKNITVPDDAYTRYDIVDGKFVLSEHSYNEYKDLHKNDVENADGSGYATADYSLESEYLYFSISNDSKSLTAYVLNYSETLKDKTKKDYLKSIGLYDEKNLSCTGTYVATAGLKEVTSDENSNTNVSLSDENIIDNGINNNVSDNKQNANNKTSNLFTLSNIIFASIIIIILILIVLLIRGNIKKKYNRKKNVVFISILLLLVISLVLQVMGFSFALSDKPGKVTGLKVVSKTSTTVRLSWNKTSNSASYQICHKLASAKKYSCDTTSTSNSKVVGSLSNYKKYNFKVRGVNAKKTARGSYSSVVTTKTYHGELYYNYLNSNEKKVYKAILSGVKKRTKTIKVPALVNTKRFSDIFQFVSFDHPELFYMKESGFSCWYNSKKKVKKFTDWHNAYFSNYSSNKKKIDKEVNKIVKVANTYKTAHEREQYIAFWLAKNVEYDYNYLKIEKKNDAKSNNEYYKMSSIYSALVNKKTICGGYTRAFDYLLSKVNVKGYVITGKASNGKHAWNRVKLSDGYYNVDTTWMASKTSVIDISRFNQKKSDFNKDHKSLDSFLPSIPSANGRLYLGFNTKKVINIDNNATYIKKGTTGNLNVKTDSNYIKKTNLIYGSYNSSILSINKSTGKMYAKNAGTARIIVSNRYKIAVAKDFVVKDVSTYMCQVVDGKYYDRSGKTVTFAEYKESCSLKIPVISKFEPHPEEKTSLLLEFNSDNNGSDYSYEIFNRTLGKMVIVSGSAKYYVFQNLKNGTYDVAMRTCSSSLNNYSCTNWSSIKTGILNVPGND